MASNDQLLRLALLIVAAILVLPFLMMLFMLPMMGLGHMWYWNGTAGSLWPLLVIGLVCLAIIVGIIYFFYRVIAGLQRDRSDAALDALRQAYARGELTSEEFEQRRERLQREE